MVNVQLPTVSNCDDSEIIIAADGDDVGKCAASVVRQAY